MTLVSAPRVFLSYARKDGEEFATALRRRLAADEPEIALWHDRAEMEGGVGWWAQIEGALDQVKFLVIVMTPQALASEVTRKEWRYARQRGVIVYPVKGVPDGQLNYAALPTWMSKAHFFDIGRLTSEGWLDAKEWQTFVSYLKSDRQPLRVPFMAPDLPHGFVSRDREFEQLLQLVLNPAREGPVSITTALQGAGGYGKTTLAIALCHDDRIVDAFDDGVLWTSLGQTPRLVDEVARLYEALTGQRPAFVDATQAAARLAEKLEHRNCLIVIDDVWDRAHLDPFLKGGVQCARLVTTRRFDLVSGAARVRVDEMSTTESIRTLATALPSGKVPDARLARLARQMGEWPLLLKLAAGMIRKRLSRSDSADGALTYVERALEKRGVTAFDQGEADQRDEAVRRTVAASRDELTAEDDRRFRDLAIFPEETAIPLTTLERLWGLDDLDTADCAQRLDDVSLLTLDLRSGVVTIHDVMRAYLLRELDDVAAVHARLLAGYGDFLRLPDSYAWRYLRYHLRHAGRVDELRALLLRPEWLQAKLEAVGPQALIGDFERVRDDRDLELVQATLRLALPALSADGTQLCEQLLGRLPIGSSERLDSFRSDLMRTTPRRRLHARWPNLQGPGPLVQTLSGHDHGVAGAVLLPDGRALSWSEDRTLRVWDVGTGESRVLTGHQHWVDGALPLPDGRALSWSEDHTLRVWNLETGESLALTGHKNRIYRALLLPGGQALSWSADATLLVWDLGTGESRALSGHETGVTGALPMSDGRVLSWSEDHTLRVWDPGTGESLALTGHENEVLGALLFRDGRALSWSADTTLRVWDLATRESRALTGHVGWVLGALLLPDGRPLSWSEDGTLRLWDVGTGESRALTGHEERVLGALSLPDGRVLSWSDDFTPRVWDLETGESRLLTGHTSWVHGALLLPDGGALSWSGDRTLRVWDLATGGSRMLAGHESVINGALLMPDGRALSWAEDHTLRVWDLGMAESRALSGHDNRILGALLLSERRALTWSADRTLRVWDVGTGESRTLAGHEGVVNGALLTPEGCVLSWSADRTLRVWDLGTWTSRALTSHQGSISGALLMSDGRALSWSDDHRLQVWDLGSGESRVLTGHTKRVYGALLMSDGRALSWSADRTLRVWDLATAESRELTSHANRVHGALLMPDGRALSWSDDNTLRVWDLETEESRTLAGHESPVAGALLLPDGRALSWSADHTLRVWDLHTGESRTLAGHEKRVNGALLLPDKRVLSWSNDCTLRVWDAGTGAGRALTGHEDWVTGALLLPDGRVLSRSHDRSVRVHDIDGRDPALAFHFDATPTVVLPIAAGELFVGDALGRIHVLEIQDASYTRTVALRSSA